MSIFPIGIIIAFVAFAAAIRHLNQGFGNYFDLVALMMVLGGTVSVGVVLIPWKLGRDLTDSLKMLFVRTAPNYAKVLEDCMSTLRNRSVPSDISDSRQLYAQVLRDGVELVGLGFSTDKVTEILVERVQAYGRRRRKVANAIRNLAKYPPAFGLMGTVLGLVNVMRGVSSGMDGKQTALEMAIALVATMYGLVFANVFINPAGEIIIKHIMDDEAYGEVALAAITLLSDSTSLLEAQEVLNSYAPIEERINAIGQMSEAA